MAESVEKYSYNGTEYSFVTKDPAQIEDLKCPICLELVYEPILTSCGHLFCRKCVKRQKTKCPTCQDPLHFISDLRDEHKVKGLKVKCPNWEKGCEWQGDLGDTGQHTDTNCQMETIPCPKGCTVDFTRGRLKQHAATCTHRSYECPHCGFKDTFISVTTTHFTTCKYFRLMCPAGCCKQLLRIKMAEHLAGCAEELVPCTYATNGCMEVIKRKDLQTHLQDKKDYHLERAMDMVMRLSMALSEMSVMMKSMAAVGVKHDTSHLPLPFRPWLQSTPTCYPHPPCVIKMKGFQEKRANKEEWHSDPIYTHFGGYKMCLKVCADRDAAVKSTHVSIFIQLMSGDNDANLKWPFEGTIKVSLLNQLEDVQHRTMLPWYSEGSIPQDTSARYIRRERVVKGKGYSKFISKDIDYEGDKNSQYLKDNTLFFRVDCFEPKDD